MCCPLQTCLSSTQTLLHAREGLHVNQTRAGTYQSTKYVNKWMLRDHNKRKVFEKYGPERIRINALRKNTILPPEIKVS